MVGGAVDAAAALAGGHDPAKRVLQLGKYLAAARLNDLEPAPAGGRCAVGRGELDVVNYRLNLDLASAATGPVVLDVSGLNDPFAAADAARQTWENAAPKL